MPLLELSAVPTKLLVRRWRQLRALYKVERHLGPEGGVEGGEQVEVGVL